MALTYAEFTSNNSNIAADIKQRILASSDWAHLQLTTGTQATTLSAIANAGATSVSTVASVPSGSYIVIGNGAANPEVRVTTGVSGAGPYTLTFATALANGYASGAAVGVGSYCKATTTRGAQMVVDVADAATNADRMQIGVYRTHDGTTGVDKLIRYLTWSANYSTNGDPLHVVVSAGKEHIYFQVDGPYTGEGANVNVGTYSNQQYFSLCDLEPYFATDTVPVVVCAGFPIQSLGTGDASTTTGFVFVSRNAANTASWVRADLLTLFPVSGVTAIGDQRIVNPTKLASDGNYYLWPFVIIEAAAGLRGRLSRIFYAGGGTPTYIVDTGETIGRKYAVAGINYTVVPINGTHGGAGSSGTGPFGHPTRFRDILLAVASP